MALEPRPWMRVTQWMQIGLVVAVFGLDFVHGMVLREHEIGFHPVYRTRQTLAVAISRMRVPPLGGYLAYGSVVDSLNQSGFAIGNDVMLDLPKWSALFNDPARMDRALQQASTIELDPARPVDLILGNELAYADYMYIGFRLFGTHMASLYYLYFVLLGCSCFLFVIEFRKKPFMMFVLTVYLASLVFLENYAQNQGDQLFTLTNSRLFEALSMLPTLHIFAVVWLQFPPTMGRFVGVLAQAALLAFIVVCRITALWQIAMIVAAALGIGAFEIWKRPPPRVVWYLKAWTSGWAAAVVVVVLAAMSAVVYLRADAAYDLQPKSHIVWHEILRGLLGASPGLQAAYLHRPGALNNTSDQDAYDAVMYDLTARHDKSSPIAFEDKGRIMIDPTQGWSAYDAMARSLVLQMVRDHPFEVLSGFYFKFEAQISMYSLPSGLNLSNLAWVLPITILGAILWWVAAGLEFSGATFWNAAFATTIILACAALVPAIEPSPLSVGTLIAYLGAFVILIAYLGRVGILLLITARKHEERSA